MPLQTTGPISMGDIRSELGSTVSNFSLKDAEFGEYGLLNIGSTSIPNGLTPSSISEWYGYNHGGCFCYVVDNEGDIGSVLTVTYTLCDGVTSGNFNVNEFANYYICANSISSVAISDVDGVTSSISVGSGWSYSLSNIDCCDCTCYTVTGGGISGGTIQYLPCGGGVFTSLFIGGAEFADICAVSGSISLISGSVTWEVSTNDCCEPTTTTTTSPPLTMVTLEYDSTTPCPEFNSGTYYINSSSFNTATQLYTDSGGSIPALAGYYSFTDLSALPVPTAFGRYWDGLSFSLDDIC